MCAWRAANGNVGTSNSPICVDNINDPSGRQICVGDVASCTLSNGMHGGQKWALHPLSAIRVVWGGVRLVGLERVDEFAEAILICVLITFSLTNLLTAPICHSDVVVSRAVRWC